LGAAPISRQAFLEELQISLNQTKIEQSWTFDKTILNHWL
jgi:leucyl/phenylalanyl-tRNA--protein transferase